ncbi:MAG: 3-deoxy-8-phosphooctulonate synthase [Candidatus Neomarinimicrobiota bacterium]
MVNQFHVGSVVFGGPDLPVIAGPCVIESRDHTLRMAEAIRTVTERLGLQLVFKSSFDKANRTAGAAFRGPGLADGLAILAEVREQLAVPVLSDVHLPDQVTAVAEAVDILQIPAFLCRQTDLLTAAAATGKPVNVKKGQFLAPWDMRNVVDKIAAAGNQRILLTERGVSFGYNNLVSDMRAITIMRSFGYPVLYDVTHSAQLPGGLGRNSGGQRAYIPAVARAAVAAGCDGIFMEVHDRPDQAFSDAATQWPLSRLEKLLSDLKRLREVICQIGVDEPLE